MDKGEKSISSFFLRACFSATRVAENGGSRARNGDSRAEIRHAHRPRQPAAAHRVSARLDARGRSLRRRWRRRAICRPRRRPRRRTTTRMLLSLHGLPAAFQATMIGVPAWACLTTSSTFGFISGPDTPRIIPIPARDGQRRGERWSENSSLWTARMRGRGLPRVTDDLAL